MNEKAKNTALVALGVVSAALGGAAIAGAADGNGSNGSNAAATTTQSTPAQPPGGGGFRGGLPPQRADEAPLTGEAESKVRAAALAGVEGATIERVETDADGHAKYEAHILKPDGTRATVYVDADFDVVGVESGRP